MTDLNVGLNGIDTSDWGNKTNNPIILQCCEPRHISTPTYYKSFNKDDVFQKQKPDVPIEADPNDKFVYYDENADNLVGLNCNQTLGKSVNPKKAAEYAKDTFKWGRRIWAAAEAYDTIDGYIERYNNSHKSEIA